MKNQSSIAISLAALSLSSGPSLGQQTGLGDLRMPPLPSLALRTENGISDQQASLATQALVSNAALRWNNRQPSQPPAGNGAAGLSYMATVAGHHAAIHAGLAVANGNAMTATMNAMSSYMPPSGDILPENTPSPGQTLIDGVAKVGQAAVTAAMMASAQPTSPGPRQNYPHGGRPSPAPMPQFQEAPPQAPVLVNAQEWGTPQRIPSSEGVVPIHVAGDNLAHIQQVSWPMVAAGAAGTYLADKAWSEGARRFPRLGEVDCKVGAGIGYVIDSLACPRPPAGVPYHMYAPDLAPFGDGWVTEEDWAASRECQREAVNDLKNRWRDCGEEADAKIRAQQERKIKRSDD